MNVIKGFKTFVPNFLILLLKANNLLNLWVIIKSSFASTLLSRKDTKSYVAIAIKLISTDNITIINKLSKNKSTYVYKSETAVSNNSEAALKQEPAFQTIVV